MDAWTDLKDWLRPNAAAALFGLAADKIGEAFKTAEAAFDALLLKPLTSAAEAGFLSPKQPLVSHRMWSNAPLSVARGAWGDWPVGPRGLGLIVDCVLRLLVTSQVLVIDALDEADAPGAKFFKAMSNPMLRLLRDQVAGRLTKALKPGAVRVVVTSRCVPAVWSIV